MANVKRLGMRATVPFNYYEDQDLASRFAFMQSPSSGLRVKFHAGETYRPNEHGGRTAFYTCEVHGEEAVSFAWIGELSASIRRIGGSCEFEADDLECNERVSGRGDHRIVETFETFDAQGKAVRVTIPGSER